MRPDCALVYVRATSSPNKKKLSSGRWARPQCLINCTRRAGTQERVGDSLTVPLDPFPRFYPHRNLGRAPLCPDGFVAPKSVTDFLYLYPKMIRGYVSCRAPNASDVKHAELIIQAGVLPTLSLAADRLPGPDRNVRTAAAKASIGISILQFCLEYAELLACAPPSPRSLPIECSRPFVSRRAPQASPKSRPNSATGPDHTFGQILGPEDRMQWFFQGCCGVSACLAGVIPIPSTEARRTPEAAD